jgi:predicted ATPase
MLKEVSVNLFDGAFVQNVVFSDGLNIISGINGAGKTNFLRYVKQNIGSCRFEGEPFGQHQIVAINPKRNSQRKTVEAVLQEFRQNNRNFDQMSSERLQAQFDDNSFHNYASISELFYAIFDRETKDGTDRTVKMQEITKQFNDVLSSVFSEYEVVSNWDPLRGVPEISIVKNGSSTIPLMGLSTGEQEVFSLILNMHFLKGQTRLFLIDEPELHLNWHLEEKLFDFFLNLTNEQNSQMIVATHSRTIFKKKFIERVQYFSWEDAKIVVRKDLPIEQKRNIAGEAIEIIKLGDFSRPTFFVEDSSHEEFLLALFRKMGKELTVTQSGNSVNVKSLFKLSKKDGGWLNSYFMVDGDGQGNQFPAEKSFIHLDKYCIENYYLSLKVAPKVLGTTSTKFKATLVRAIQARGSEILKTNKYLAFLLDRLKSSDITQESLDLFDGSVLLSFVLDELGVARTKFVSDMIDYWVGSNRLNSFIPENLGRVLSE